MECHPGSMIVDQRTRLGLSSTDLARKTRINVKTIHAIEHYRIKNPSIKNLLTIADALETSVAALFSGQVAKRRDLFYAGGQKGHRLIDFKPEGCRVVAYTPLTKDLFVGRVMIRGHKTLNFTQTRRTGKIFAQTILGRICLRMGGHDHVMKEGSYVVFDGSLEHEFINPQGRESSFFLATTPSFLARG
jgi:DNA-binding XRE family transcriptional regulator